MLRYDTKGKYIFKFPKINSARQRSTRLTAFSGPKGTRVYTGTTSTGHVIRVAINETTILVPYLQIKSLQLFWRLGIRRWNLRVPDLQMSCRDLTQRQGTRIATPVIATKMTSPIIIPAYITKNVIHHMIIKSIPACAMSQIYCDAGIWKNKHGIL